MGRIRVQHVFTVLLGASALTAFVIPPRFTEFARPHLESLFAPVSRPAGAVAARVRSRVSPPKNVDDRPAEDVKIENDRLRQTVVNLAEQLALLQEINADREALGQARRLCTPVAVVGGDAGLGTRETLQLSAGTNDNVRKDMYALYAGGIAGRISGAGIGGSVLQLITDPNVGLTGTFVRYEKNAQGQLELQRIGLPPALVQGRGRNTMVVEMLSYEAVAAANVRPGDWLILHDRTWPEPLQGYRIGQVQSVDKRRDAPLLAEIKVAPQCDLMQLREVMVMNKDKADPVANTAEGG
jgi:cell shape-determining protein MreC